MIKQAIITIKYLTGMSRKCKRYKLYNLFNLAGMSGANSRV